MSIQNSLTAQKKQTFSTFLTSDAVKNKINQMIQGKDGGKFITSLISIVSNNPEIAKCDHTTILSSALLGESLKLSPSPQLGQFYIVPFKDNKNGRMVAQFQLGYKGYIQLAMRSGQYRDIDVFEIKEGEYKGKDKFSGRPVIEFIEDDDERESLQTIGYFATFELINGFRKSMFWSITKMQKHAQKYSQAYRSDINKGNSYSFWSKDFDGMAFKTMLRQLISKWGIMSVEFQTTVANDMAAINEDGLPEYVDNEENIIEAELIKETATKDNGEGNNDPLNNFE